MIETILTQEKELGKIQDPSTRQMAQIFLRAHIIAQYSFDPKNILTLLEGNLPPISGLLGEMFNLHLLRCLKFFLEDPEFQRLSERLMMDSKKIGIEFRKALLIPLRQSVGSCFATAFLINLQNKDLHYLAKDLYQTFVKKKMSRIISGEEIKIPFCPKTGITEVQSIPIASPMMKSYEYTVASLADIEIGFSKWNFHEALGLDFQANGGLGKVIYDLVDEKLNQANRKIDELNREIDLIERDLDFDDASFRAASSIDRMNSIKRSAKGKHLHLNRMYDDVEDEGKVAENLSRLYKFFVEQYIALYPYYFQELYDPEMFSEGDIEEDRPAGFRLVYKHGRSDPRVWSYIYTDDEYIQALFDFITGTEQILLSLKREEGLEKDIETIISELLLAIRTPEFITDQKMRIAQMHKKHLKEENNISPYAYIAGGNLKSLIKTYSGIETDIRSEKLKCETPLDLCFSIIEFMKDATGLDFEAFEKDPFKGILICNDTHAFNLLPGQPALKKAWMNSGNTYSYIRDVLMKETDPIVFADSNWSANFLAFRPNSDHTDFDLHLFDGINSIEFTKWSSMFKKDAYWEIYL
ncbi:MAG: hypothetical protein S4CHLAM20_05280 [Chlamydiia bacterium]|nr:hypothetical protein [Chlamydiia bacterium]